MLASGTTESYLQVSETPLDITFDGGINQGKTMIEEGDYFAIFFKEEFYRSVSAIELAIWFISAGVMNGTAVKYKSAPVSGRVNGETFFIRERQYSYG